MPTPAQHAALAALAERLDVAAHGEKSGLIDATAADMGVCAQTIHAWLRSHRGERRKRRSDAGRSALTREELTFISAIVQETIRDNGKEGLSLTQAINWPVEQPVGFNETAAVSFGGELLAYSAFTVDTANDIARRNIPGYFGISFSDRAPTASITVLAPELSVFDPFALADTGDVQTITTTHDNRDGYKVRIDLLARVLTPAYTQIDQDIGYQLTLEPYPVVGDDEITITCL